MNNEDLEFAEAKAQEDYEARLEKALAEREMYEHKLLDLIEEEHQTRIAAKIDEDILTSQQTTGVDDIDVFPTSFVPPPAKLYAHAAAWTKVNSMIEVAAIALVTITSGVLGRQYSNFRGEYGHTLHTCIIAPSGSGKDCVTNIADQFININDALVREGSSISGRAQMSEVRANIPNGCIYLREASRAWYEASGVGKMDMSGTTPLQAIVNMFDRTSRSGDEHVMIKGGKTIPKGYIQSFICDMQDEYAMFLFSSINVATGLTSRITIGTPSIHTRRPHNAISKQEAIKHIETIAEIANGIDPVSSLCGISSDAYSIINAFESSCKDKQREAEKQQHKGVAAMYTRAAAQAERLAMAAAVYCNPSNPTVSVDDINWGIYIINKQINAFSKVAIKMEQSIDTIVTNHMIEMAKEEIKSPSNPSFVVADRVTIQCLSAKIEIALKAVQEQFDIRRANNIIMDAIRIGKIKQIRAKGNNYYQIIE